MNTQGEAHMPHSHRTTVTVPAFLIKTYQLVDDASTNHIVSWGEDNTTFVVWEPLEMAHFVLPRIFMHSNFSSFVRHLNLYGFRKVAPDRWEFANEYFRKGAKHLLSKIKIQKAENASSSRAPLNNLADNEHCCTCNGVMPFTTSSSLSSMIPFMPSLSSSSPMIPPTEELLGSPAFDISSENGRFARGDHAKLLAELTRIRCLYEESLCIIQQQNLMKETKAPQKCLTKACECHHLQHQHVIKFPLFEALDDPVRKERDLQVDSTRENRNKCDTSMKSVDPPCVYSDMRSLMPSSQSSLMTPACIEVGREVLSLLDENNRLRRDNTILLSELTHVRKLYNEALSIIEIQKSHLEEANQFQQRPSSLSSIDGQSRDMQAAFIDSSAAPSLSRADIMRLKRDYMDSPCCDMDAYHDTRKFRGCQEAIGHMTQPATIDITREKTPSYQSVSEGMEGQIRLFGVPLHSEKRVNTKKIYGASVLYEC